MTDSTLFPRCNPKEAPDDSGLVCGAVRPITEGVHWDTTGCEVPEKPSNGCEQCPTDGGSGECPECPEPAPVTPVPDGCYTQVCFTDNIPTYGQAPEPVIDFGQRQEWCSFGLSYAYEDGKVTKQGTALPDGTYTRFTIQNGCVVDVGLAPLPVYMPAECCEGDGSGGNSFNCGDVAACLGAFPYAGDATPTTRLIGANGQTYTIGESDGGDELITCDDIVNCLSALPSGGEATELTMLVGADGSKYFVPFPDTASGFSATSCGLVFDNGILTDVPTTNPPVGDTISEFGWPPVMGAQTEGFLKVSKANCRLNFTIDNLAVRNAVISEFVQGTEVPDGAVFLAGNGEAYSIEAISDKVYELLNLGALQSQVNAIQAQLNDLQDAFDSHENHPPVPPPEDD